MGMFPDKIVYLPEYPEIYNRLLDMLRKALDTNNDRDESNIPLLVEHARGYISSLHDLRKSGVISNDFVRGFAKDIRDIEYLVKRIPNRERWNGDQNFLLISIDSLLNIFK